MVLPIRAAALAVASLLSLVILAALVPVAAQAGRPRVTPSVVVTAPVNGVFTNAGSVTVTGHVLNAEPSSAVVTVNGVVVPLDSNGTFSYALTLNPSIVFNPIETRLVAPQFSIDRRVVIAGESVADGDYSFDSLALRLNDSGLDALEPVVTSLVDLDLATLVPPGTQVINEFCVLRIIFCTLTADAFIEGTPPPSIGAFSIDIDSQPGFAFGDILLNNLFIRVKVQKGSVGIIGFTCHVNINAATTNIEGDFGLEPMEGAPEFVDVEQIGGARVMFGGFNDATDCEGILGGLLELFIDLLVGDIQDLMQPAFEDFLNQTDLAGNTAVGGAIEAALSEISIAGPIGESLNVALSAPLFQVAEDANGITLGADAAIVAQIGTGPGQCSPPPGTADLSASYHVTELFPSFGPTTPVGGLPYDLGIAISTSAFNQLLKAQVECGLLQTELTEFEYLGVSLPLTAGVLALLLPEFHALTASLPLVARLQPSTAPVLTGNAGPQGEATELRLGQLVVDFRRDPSIGINEISYLKLAVDFRVGLDFEFADGALVPVISAVNVEDIQVSVISSYFPTITPEDVQGVLPGVLAGALPELSGTLGSFPIPAFFGFQLQPVEVGSNGEFLGIFADLVPAP